MTTAETGIKPSKERFRIIPKDAKFKVRPNLSLRGKDIQTRLKNNTLDTDADRQYSLDEKIDETRKLSKLELNTKVNENNRKIQDLNDRLNKAKNT